MILNKKGQTASRIFLASTVFIIIILLGVSIYMGIVLKQSSLIFWSSFAIGAVGLATSIIQRFLP